MSFQSSHNQRVLLNSKFYLTIEKYCSFGEYIFGDSAYTPHVHVIPCFTKLPRSTLTRQDEQFNAAAARKRITVEHCIGVVKDGKRSLTRMIQHIEDFFVLHNLCCADSVPKVRIEPELPDVALRSDNSSSDLCMSRSNVSGIEQLLNIV
ncbi:hypothetical protein THRCLA_22831 [Thraustotheca clavata]|uniref:DDE Tnp4 domain-containing protein n=1 Tax=Thraustotheca clavata TaxID=74557 RepID=A0A1V9YS84_9STRA|nr:hypothetical protein THRCLA_22831 [Thraustotheca clavata]